MSYRWRAITVAIAWLNATLIPLIGVPMLLPAIGAEFGTSTTATAWVALAYSLAMAGAFMPASHVGDLLGHKRVALFGSYMEVAFMLVIVAAPNLGVLIALRFGQGLVHSLAVPNFNALAIGGFPQERRGRASGMMGGAIGVGMLVVPVFVGLVTDQLGWRWVFAIGAIIVLAITVVGGLALRGDGIPRRARPAIREFDVPGATLLMAAMAPLIVGVQLLRRSDTAWPWLLFAVAAVLLVAFVWLQARLEHATLPVRMFKKAAFAVPSAYNIAVQFTQGVAVYLLPLFFIQGLGWTGTHTGLVMAAMAGARPPASFASGFLADRWGGMPVTLLGATSLFGALVGLALGGSTGTLSGLLPFMLLFGMSHSMLQTGLQKQMYAAVPRGQLAMAPGVLGLGRHLGQAIGVGVAATIYSAVAGDAASTTANASDGFRAALLATAAIVAITFVGAAAAVRSHRLVRQAEGVSG